MATVCAAIMFMMGVCLRTLSQIAFLGFDNSSLAHFFGWLGLSILALSCSCSDVSIRQRRMGMCALAVITAISFFLASRFTDALFAYNVPYIGVLWRYSASMVCLAAFFEFCEAVCLVFRKKDERAGLPWKFTLKWMVAFALGWELVWQPFVNVYSGPPRGSVQWSQVFADQLAFVLAWWLLSRKEQVMRK